MSPGTREELQSLVRSRSLPAGLVRRAEIVLLCADGLDNQTVAERVRTSRVACAVYNVGCSIQARDDIGGQR